MAAFNLQRILVPIDLAQHEPPATHDAAHAIDHAHGLHVATSQGPVLVGPTSLHAIDIALHLGQNAVVELLHISPPLLNRGVYPAIGAGVLGNALHELAQRTQ